MTSKKNLRDFIEFSQQQKKQLQIMYMDFKGFFPLPFNLKQFF